MASDRRTAGDAPAAVERRVLRLMGGADYLGPEFSGDAYRLKFVKDGRVDPGRCRAATGRIKGQFRADTASRAHGHLDASPQLSCREIGRSAISAR